MNDEILYKTSSRIPNFEILIQYIGIIFGTYCEKLGFE